MDKVHSVKLVLTGLLAAGYSALLVLIFNPDTSALYQAIYVDRAGLELPDRIVPAGSLIAGLTLDHVPTNKAGVFVGWSEPEANHRWSEGKVSRLIFRLAPGSIPVAGEILLRAGYLGDQRIAVYLNHEFLLEYAAADFPEHVTIPFEPELLEESGLNVLEFRFPDARRPGIDDNRELAMAFRGMEIR